MTLNRLQTLLLVLVASCSSKVDEQIVPAASSTPPADTVDPNGLVEGEAEIFGLRLPSRASINRRTQLSASAQIPWQFDRVANFFRERLDAEAVEVGPRNTIFRHAKIKGDTSGDTFNVIVKRTGHTAEVAVRKEPRKADPATDDVLAPPKPDEADAVAPPPERRAAASSASSAPSALPAKP